jgi:hypothetical protein
MQEWFDVHIVCACDEIVKLVRRSVIEAIDELRIPRILAVLLHDLRFQWLLDDRGENALVMFHIVNNMLENRAGHIRNWNLGSCLLTFECAREEL